jgi:hypothetical protein
MSTPQKDSHEPDAISFGKAGKLYVGVDAEVMQGCEAIMHAYHRFCHGRGRLTESYDMTVRSIEERAKIIAPLSSSSPAGIEAKARVVYELSRIGMACGAARILAASLAADVLAGAQ